MKKTTKVIAVLMLSLASTLSNAISTTPTQQQLAQFQKLPKAQQEALAKQFGVDLSTLNTNASAQQSLNEPAPEAQYFDAEPKQMTPIDSKESSRAEKNGLKPFGYEMFERMQGAFLPSGNIPIPADYVIGPGDSLDINLYGKDTFQYTLQVNNAGKVNIPGLDPISVTGLTYTELKAFISDVIATEMIGMKASLTISNLRSIQVYIVGDVKNPGAYHLSSLSTLTNALFVSGGPNAVGSLRNIQLKRAGKTIANFDLYKMFTQGDVSQDLRIQQGDVVFVGTIDKQVAIGGEVRRPAIYELTGDETVGDLIDMAGGLNVNAYPKHAILARFDENYQRDVQRINLNNEKFIKKKLKNGDVLTVLPVSDRLDQVVNVAGSVSRPTTYAWFSGMTLSDLIVNKDDLMETTDLNYGLILTQKDLGRYEVTQFKPKDILQGNSEILAPGDLVVFFNRYDQKTFIKNGGDYFDHAKAEKTSDVASGIDEIFDTEYDLSAEETDKFNFLYAIQNGSLFDKQDALRSTKFLSRKQLIQPIVNLLSDSHDDGKYVPVVSLTGQVRFPGFYPIGRNSTLEQIILAGGGLTESANLSIGEVSRRIQREDEYISVEHIKFSLQNSDSELESGKIKLKPRDVINIFQQANWNEELRVTLNGEVKYPGEYTVKEGETLTEVLARAGGLTDNAAENSAFFTRVSLKEIEKNQARAMARALSKELALKSVSSSVSSININEVQTLVANLSEIEGVGRLVINLDNILDGTGEDISLENGDVLTVPAKSNIVNVIGEVQVPTSHIYRTDWQTKNYIESSGGMRAQADESRVYVVKANGLVSRPQIDNWFSSDEVIKLQPGDTIVVPLDAGHTDKLTLWEKATAIFYQLSVGLVALGNLN